MISLKEPTEPFTLVLMEAGEDSLTVTVRPRSSFDLAVARAAAARQLDALECGQDVCAEHGVIPRDRMVDLGNEDIRAGLLHQFMVAELAVAHVIGWTGVSLDGTPAAVSRETVTAVMAIWPPGSVLPLGEIFYRQFMRRHEELDAAKKDCGTAAPGISETAVVPDTATPAGETARRAHPAGSA